MGQSFHPAKGKEGGTKLGLSVAFVARTDVDPAGGEQRIRGQSEKKGLHLQEVLVQSG